MKGKCFETFGPLGPWLVTTDEIKDVQNLGMFLDVNGKRMQTGTTKTMIFSIAHLVHYISQFMVLEAGDVITTGTPPGVGLGMKPPVFLKDGDVMHLGIDGLGEQKQNGRPLQALTSIKAETSAPALDTTGPARVLWRCRKDHHCEAARMEENVLLRYTNLAAAIHLLRNRCLTLLNPATWTDRNDAFFLAEYKAAEARRKRARPLLHRTLGNLPSLASVFIRA